jgi:hypothetical protein
MIDSFNFKNYIIITIMIILPSLSLGQKKLQLDNSITGTHSTTKFGNQSEVMINGSNTLQYKNFVFDFVPYYSLVYSPRMSENELNLRENIRFEGKKMNVFITMQYNKSFIRDIKNEHWVGIGGGKKFYNNEKFKYSISYAVIYDKKTFTNGVKDGFFRNSLRGKAKYKGKLANISFEYFYQPAFSDFNDYIIYGKSQLILLPSRPINFVIEQNLNYINFSKVRLIQSVSFGINYSLEKDLN